MSKKSNRQAFGIVAYLQNPLRVLLALPGGPYKSNAIKKWVIPKGMPHESESDWACAIREFKEETNLYLSDVRKKKAIDLGSIIQKGGKQVKVWAVEMENDDLSTFKSNTFLFKWPNNKHQEYPEIDEIKYFSYKKATGYLREEHLIFIDRLKTELSKKSS